MNENFQPPLHPQSLATEASTVCQREEFLFLDCGRLLRRELGLYFETDPTLRTFRIHRALDELRLIQTELETILNEEIGPN